MPNSDIDAILIRLDELTLVTSEILREAREAENPLLALKAVDRLERQLELLARLKGELRSTHAHVHLTPQLDALREVLLRSLTPFPDARIAAASALQEIVPVGTEEAD